MIGKVADFTMQGGLKSEMQHPAGIGMSVDCGLRHLRAGIDQFAEGLDQAAPVERLARPVVEQIGNGVQCLPRSSLFTPNRSSYRSCLQLSHPETCLSI